VIESLLPRLRVWHVLALAFAVRFAVGLSTDSVLQPDEVMQYLEQAHRLVFGPGMIPWEYDYGTRSWAPALLVAGILETVRRVGFDTPQIYQPVVEAVLSAASLAIPYSAYRIGRALYSESAARLALLFTAFWYELVTYGHRSTIDALAAYPVFGALALVFADPRRRVTVSCGVLAGLACVLRYQLAPAIAVIGLVAIWRWRWRVWPAALAGLLVVVAGGALDKVTWGVWFASIVTNFDFNVSQNQMVRFGTEPFYWYALSVGALSGGLCLVGALGLALSWRVSWPLLAVGLVTAGAFSAVAHKESRFVFLLTPLWLIGLAALVADRGHLLARAAPRPARLAPAAAVVLTAGFIGVSVLGLDLRLPFEGRFVLRRHIARVPTREAYRALAQQQDVVAVLDVSGNSGWYLPPYYDLHHNVPLYFPLSRGYRTAVDQPARYVSHVIAPRDAPPPQGFRELTRVRGLTIWRRIADPPNTDEVFGWEPRIHALQPIRTPPTVRPRW
jgi:phosphatidylinositol glycan class B